MKQPIKLLLALLGAGSVTALAFFGWSAKAKEDATFHLANGVQVTPVEVKLDDMAQLLDVKIWKFDVYLPNPEEGNSLVLNLYQHGKRVKSLAGGGFGPSRNPSHHLLVTIGIAPDGGDFSKAGQVRWMLQQNGGATRGAFVNPFQASKGLGWNTQAVEADNLIYLMSGTNSSVSHGDARENDTTIALSLSNTF